MNKSTPGFDLRYMPGFGILALGCFIFLYLPIVLLIVFSFNDNESTVVWGGWSLRWFISAWNNPQIIDVSFRSLRLAITAASIASIISLAAAFASTRQLGPRMRVTVDAVLLQPLVIPELVLAVALLVVFSSIKAWTGYTGELFLVIAHTAICIPFAFLPIRARLQNMDTSLEAAAADLYATNWQAFRLVTLPLIKPGVLAGLILAFVTSLDNVVITELTKSAGHDTLPTYILGQIRRVVTPEINAVSTVFLLISTVVAILVFSLEKKK